MWAAVVGLQASGSSPLSRGILSPMLVRFSGGRIIPALAGNTRDRRGGTLMSPDHPRSRGEYASVLPACMNLYGSSPLSRGILSCRSSSVCSPWDHPRSRGEYTCSLVSTRRNEGSSPLSRGIRVRRRVVREPVGIIPALAGNTNPSHSNRAMHQDHPRSRGEYTC